MTEENGTKKKLLVVEKPDDLKAAGEMADWLLA